MKYAVCMLCRGLRRHQKGFLTVTLQMVRLQFWVAKSEELLLHHYYSLVSFGDLEVPVRLESQSLLDLFKCLKRILSLLNAS